MHGSIMRNDKRLALAAAHGCGLASRRASASVRSDRCVVSATVHKAGVGGTEACGCSSEDNQKRLIIVNVDANYDRPCVSIRHHPVNPCDLTFVYLMQSWRHEQSIQQQAGLLLSFGPEVRVRLLVFLLVLHLSPPMTDRIGL